MVTRLAPDARSMVTDAEAEARAAGSSLVEAEHLLLAMSTRAESEASRALASVGLTHETITEALDGEFAASLSSAGISVDTGSLGRPSPEPPRRLRLSASFKSALERALTASAGSRQISSGHLLLGVLGADAGTVPRALRLAGINQSELAAITRHELDG